MASRVRNECVEEGRYSEFGFAGIVGSGCGLCLKGRTFLVREAVRERMAARWGAVLERLSNLLGCSVILRGQDFQ